MIEGQCPSCGAAIAFSAGSAQVLVCAHCNTVVGREGAALRNRGHVSAIVDTGSPLQLGAAGAFRGEAFRIIGHLQKDRGGAPWDEWAIEFDSGASGWLSESEGAFHLLRFVGDNDDVSLSSLRPGAEYPIDTHRFVVEELARARTVGAEGQLPSDVDPDGELAYADLTGAKGLFATLDFGTRIRGAEVFVGCRVALEALNIDPGQLRPRVKRAEVVQARCTECNGPLELRAPDRTRRVACPYCGALLDVSQGRLSFLQALGKPKFEPIIDLGAPGTLEGVRWTCIGFQRRSSVEEGITYPWDEYLLYSRGRGFAWLVESSGHWTFLEGVAAGDITSAGSGGLLFEGRVYKRFAAAEATTDYVLGEFYWEVNVGDRVHGREFIDPPRMLSEERTGEELSFSHGRYLRPAEVRKAFNLKVTMPSQHAVGPAQPNPHQVEPALTWAFIYALALVAIFFVVTVRAADQVVFNEQVDLPSGRPPPGSPESFRFSAPFEVHRRGNMEVSFEARGLVNDWLGLEGDLVNEETGEVISFYVESGYWQGPDWSEGSQRDTTYLSAIEPGRYVLRTSPVSATGVARTYSLTLTSDTPRITWLVVALVLLFIWPTVVGMRSSVFETSRWSQSSFGGDT